MTADWITTNEAADMLSLSPRTVREYAQAGAFGRKALLQVGQTYRIRRSALERWIEKRAA